MDVAAESQPQHHHRKMGPKEAKNEPQAVINDSWLEAEPLTSSSNRPAPTMLERRSKIPLHVQLMMASGPVNGREVVYYPWDNGKGMASRPSKKEGQGEKAKNRTRKEAKGDEAVGIVEV